MLLSKLNYYISESKTSDYFFKKKNWENKIYTLIKE